MTRAYVGLGANLGEPEQMLRLALERLAAEPSVELVAASQLRETEPEDFLDQPRFLNAAAAVETDLSPRQLLARLQLIECELGRRRAAAALRPARDRSRSASLRLRDGERARAARFRTRACICAASRSSRWPSSTPSWRSRAKGRSSALLAGLD